jgi:hypothetical protein
MTWLAELAKKTQDIPIAGALSDRLQRKSSKYSEKERDDLLVKIEILTARNTRLQSGSDTGSVPLDNQLSEEEICILKTLDAENEGTAHQVAQAFDFSLARAQYHLTRLAEMQYLVSNTALERTAYMLDKRGREYLAASSQS